MKKKLSVILFLLGMFGIERASAQTFTFECVCDYVSSPDCDICNSQTQSRLLNGLLIRRSGVAFKWIEYPYMVRIQGTNAVIQELIFPNPETVTINLAGTGFANMSEYMDSLQCNCGGGSVSFIAGPGILISGDTISAVDTSATNEIQQVDTLLFSSDTLRISLSSDGVPQKKVYIPATVISEPAEQVVYGTGSGVDSDTSFLYSNEAFNVYQTKFLNLKGRMFIGYQPGDGVQTADVVIRGKDGAGLDFADLRSPRRKWQLFKNYDGFFEMNTIDTGGVNAQTVLTLRDDLSRATWSWPLYLQQFVRFEDQTNPIIFFNPSGSNLYRKYQIGTDDAGTFGIRKINNGEFAGDFFLKAVADPSNDERIKRLELNVNGNNFLLRNDTTNVDGNVYLTDYTGGAKDGTISKTLGVDSNNKLVTATPSWTTGSGTADYVTVWNTSSTLTGYNRFVWKNSTNRLGIGTTSPRDAISINGGNGAISFFNTTNPVPYVGLKWDQTADIFGLMRNACCDSLTVWGLAMKRGDGFIGINTTSPTEFLDVNGNARFRGLTGTPTVLPGLDATGVMGSISLSGLTLSGGTLSPTNILPSGTNKQTIRHDGSAWVATSFLSNDGSKIGINTTSPSDMLEVNEGALNIASSSNNASLRIKSGGGWDGEVLQFYEGSDKVFYLRQNGTANSLTFSGEGTSTQYDIDFKTALNASKRIGFTGSYFPFSSADAPYNEWMRLTAGKLGIGTATPAQTLHVQGTARITGSDGTATAVMGRDGDGDVSALALSGLTISGGTLTATGDNWGSQVVQTTGSTLDGNGTVGSPMKVSTGGIGDTELASTTVTAGSYGSATQVGTFTTNGDGRITAASNVTITGTLSGLTAPRIPFVATATSLQDDALLSWNNTTKRLSVGNTGGSPAAAVHIAEGSVASWEPLRAVGTVSGNMVTTISNAQNAGGASNNIFQMRVGGSSGGDPVQQYTVDGVGTWSMGIDNSNADKFILGYQSLPGGGFDYLTLTTGGNVGIKNNAPSLDLSVGGTGGIEMPSGTTGQRVSSVLPSIRYNSTVQGIEVTSPQGIWTRLTSHATPTGTVGTGAGTGGSISFDGAANDIFGTFTIGTGTSPAAGATVCTITFNQSFAAGSRVAVSLEALNDSSVSNAGKYRVDSITNASFKVVTIAGQSLPASTASVLQLQYKITN